MNTDPPTHRRSILLLLTVVLSALISTTAHAGDVYLTGHDTLLHGGQNGYDAVILDYLRGATPKASYDIGVVGTANTGSGSFTGGGNVTTVGHGGNIPLVGTTLTGYGSAKFYDAALLAADPARATILAGLDVLVVLSHTSCGGCSLTTAGSNALNTMAGDIATAFNAGMDIWGNSSASLVDNAATAIVENYYGFLPAGAVATGTSISGSTGFVATAEGVAIGIQNDMINGYPTHNRFTSQAAAFTVFETRPLTGSTETISIGLRDGVINGGGITTPGTSVPDSGATAILLGLVLPLLGLLHRRLRAAA